jgi:hypothetical protein
MYILYTVCWHSIVNLLMVSSMSSIALNLRRYGRVRPSVALTFCRTNIFIWGMMIDLTHPGWAAWSIPGMSCHGYKKLKLISFEHEIGFPSPKILYQNGMLLV